MRRRSDDGSEYSLPRRSRTVSIRKRSRTLTSFGKYIAEHNVDAADWVVADIFDALPTLVASPRIRH